MQLREKHVAALHCVVRQHADERQALVDLVEHLSMQLSTHWPDLRIRSSASSLRLRQDSSAIVRNNFV